MRVHLIAIVVTDDAPATHPSEIASQLVQDQRVIAAAANESTGDDLMIYSITANDLDIEDDRKARQLAEDLLESIADTIHPAV